MPLEIVREQVREEEGGGAFALLPDVEGHDLRAEQQIAVSAPGFFDLADHDGVILHPVDVRAQHGAARLEFVQTVGGEEPLMHQFLRQFDRAERAVPADVQEPVFRVEEEKAIHAHVLLKRRKGAAQPVCRVRPRVEALRDAVKGIVEVSPREGGDRELVVLCGHVDDKAVAALGFAAVERLVAQGEKPLKAVRVRGEDGAADRRGGEDPAAADQQILAKNGVGQIHVVQHAVEPVIVGAAEVDEQELVPAVAAHNAVLAKEGAKLPGNKGQHLIPGAVAVIVIDAFEVVQINDSQHERRLFVDEGADEAENMGPRNQPREGVVHGGQGSGLQKLPEKRIACEIFGGIHMLRLLALITIYVIITKKPAFCNKKANEQSVRKADARV